MPNVRTLGDVNLIDVSGRLTLGSKETDEMGAIVRDLLHAGKKKILINLARVAYIDSSSLGVLVAHSKRAAERSAVIKILNPNESVAKVFATTNLDAVFEIFQDEQEAVASFG